MSSATGQSRIAGRTSLTGNLSGHLILAFPRQLLYLVRVTREKRWTILYDRARIDVILKVESGSVTGFSVNLGYRRNDDYDDVIRYDTAHGYVHVHRFWISPEIQQWRSYEDRPLSAAFDAAYEDVKEHWERYIELFKREVINGRDESEN